MADTKTTGLNELNEQPNNADLVPVVDVSDTTMSANGTNKKVTVANLRAGLQESSTAVGELSDLSDVDSTVSSPSDGDILVYRSAGSNFVLEAKPAAGSNPAAADITDSTTAGQAMITAADADAQRTLLNVEDGADATDATNVAAAGALMESEVTNLAQVKAFDSSDYATAAQGATADSALQDITSESLTNLADVDTDKSKTPADGDVLTFDGTDWNAETPAGGGGGISDVVDDTSPQLGGDLDLNGNDIVTTSNGDINLLPNGSGKVIVDGDVELDNYGAVRATYLRNGPDNAGLQVEAGDSSAGTAGNLMLDAGDTTTGTGGNVIIKPGAGGSGTAGDVQFKHEDGLKSLTFDYSAISTDRTLTYPDSNVDLGDIATSVQTDDTDVSSNSWVVDEDDMSSDSATKVPTQQSVKAYVDANAGGGGGGGNPFSATYVIGSGGDYATLNAWYADSPANGDILFIDGDHTLTASITITHTDIHIIGSKNSRIELDAYQLTFNGTGCVVEGVGIDVTNAGGNTGIRGSGTHFTMRHTEWNITDSGAGFHIYLTGANALIENNKFISTVSNMATLIRLDGAEGTVTGNKMDLTSMGSGYYAVYTYGTDALISNNHIMCSSVGSSSVGIQSQGNNSTVTGNRMENLDNFLKSGTGLYIKFTNNTLTATATVSRCIYFEGAFGAITGNMIQVSAVTDCIYLTNQSCLVQGNTLHGTSGDGIDIQANDDKNAIVGNLIAGFGIGIKVGSSLADDTLIMANALLGNGTNILDSGTDTMSTTATDGDPLNQLV